MGERWLLRGLLAGEVECALTLKRLKGLERSAVEGVFPDCTGRDWALLRGGLLYAVDALEEAHAIFQDDHTAEGSYWHGMLHRREGDFSNAIYWFQRAGPIAPLRSLENFSPERFARECSRASENGPEFERLLRLQRAEWEVMMESVWARVSRAK